jgi:hypothetical protein
LHADDTPLPVLAPGNGKTLTARLWTHVHDDRASANDAPAAVWFAYSSDRNGEHPQRHLANFSGVLQADAYAGFNAVYSLAMLPKLRAGHMPAANLVTCMQRGHRRLLARHCAASASCMPSKKAFMASNRTNAGQCGGDNRGHYLTTWNAG